MVARHLISPLWLEEMTSDDDDDALLCSVALFVCGRQPGSSMGLEPLATSYSSTQVPCCRSLQLKTISNSTAFKRAMSLCKNSLLAFNIDLRVQQADTHSYEVKRTCLGELEIVA